MKLNMVFYSSELSYYATVLNYFTVYAMKHFNYKWHVVIQILRMKNYLEIVWLLQNSHYYSDKKTAISVIQLWRFIKNSQITYLNQFSWART